MNIAHLSPSTTALGPGERAVVWVRGCPLACPGCLAPAWQSPGPAWWLTPQEILHHLSLPSHISGLTISGGEPMLQASGLAVFIRLARAVQHLTVICYTGFSYKKLVNDPPSPGVDSLLAQVDVLIDGPYIQRLNPGVGLRGSTNQVVHHLTDRLAGCDFTSIPRRLDVRIGPSGFSFAGIPPLRGGTSLERVLERLPGKGLVPCDERL